MKIESMGGNEDTDADRKRFSKGESKDEEATVVERFERSEKNMLTGRLEPLKTN